MSERKKRGEVKKKAQVESSPPSTSAPAFSQDEYNEVVSAADLVSVNLQQVRFNFNEVAYFNSQREKAKRRNTIDNSVADIFFDSENGIAQASFVWSVEIRVERRKVFFAEAKYSVLYDGLETLKESAVRSFLRRVGRIAVYPYFRALVAHLSADAGANLPTLPVYKILKPAAPREVESSKQQD
jgi:hypothetical protein